MDKEDRLLTDDDLEKIVMIYYISGSYQGTYERLLALSYFVRDETTRILHQQWVEGVETTFPMVLDCRNAPSNYEKWQALKRRLINE